jgi:selenide,water dikinase
MLASNLEPLSLILTKPLGIGLLLAASMRNQAPDGAYQNCVDVMLASNTSAAEFLWQNEVLAMTDVTGFGLARHIENVIQNIETKLNVKMGAALFLHKIPILDGASKILENTSIRASLSHSNKNSVSNFTNLNTKNTSLSDILFDPQTSGGIVAVVPTANADKLVAHLQENIAPRAAIIGSLSFVQTGIIAN